jgi:hypothetical protein
LSAQLKASDPSFGRVQFVSNLIEIRDIEALTSKDVEEAEEATS